MDKTSALARRAVEYGNLVEKYTVVVLADKGGEMILSDKVKIYGVAGGNKFIKLLNLWRQAKILLKNEAYDIITVQDQYYLALIGLCLAKKFKVGLEIQVHGFEKYNDLRKLIAKYVLPRANAVRCVSRRLKRQLINEFGIKEEKITVVPIHSELRITNYELRIKRDKEKFIFLAVGRLVPVKNISLQIEAMTEVVKKYPDAELWIIGDGPESNNLKFKIKNLKLDDNVKLFGRKSREELETIYSEADIFMLSSDSEGWGMAVIEAASFGLPIIMTDVGCAGEVIKNGESGLLIPIGDKRKLVEAMLKIIEDENLRKKLGANAKLAVSRLPSKERTLELYKKSWEIAVAN